MDADSPRGFREAMKVINHSTIQSLGISPQDAYQWVEEMLVQKQHSILPPKISMRQNNHIFYNVMSCILPQEDCVGVKVITRHPEKIQGPSLTSQILLYKASTGDLFVGNFGWKLYYRHANRRCRNAFGPLICQP